jgi:hypothetical protein
VASKRFPLSDEQLARFRFARIFAFGDRVGQVAPDEFAEPMCGFA